jgi:hypothetical protein
MYCPLYLRHGASPPRNDIVIEKLNALIPLLADRFNTIEFKMNKDSMLLIMDNTIKILCYANGYEVTYHGLHNFVDTNGVGELIDKAAKEKQIANKIE